MSSAVEQLANNVSLSAFSKATELKQRLLFVVLALIVYRLGTYLPLPGIDATAVSAFFTQQAGGITGMLNLFSGGALERMSIFALNIMPYISASIVVQLLSATSPKMEALKKEGEAGRRKINQYTRYGTVLLALVQAYGLAVSLEALEVDGRSAVADPGYFFRMSVVVTIVGGTLMLMWLGEQITQRGVGNGISLIIFAGIVAELPRALANFFDAGRDSIPAGIVLLVMALAVGIIVFVVFMERSQRRLQIQYPRQQTQRGYSAPVTSYLPLKLNTAGVIPPIFASALLLLPATIIGFSGGTGGDATLDMLSRYLSHGHWFFTTIYMALIIFFCFFYTAIVFNPADTADNLKRSHGTILGVRPGKPTADHIDKILTRITGIGALYLAFVCLVPELLIANYNSIPFYLGGTSLLIVVTVTIDTVGHIHSHLVQHQYSGLINKSKLRGRRR